jgi:hypothetical protein
VNIDDYRERGSRGKYSPIFTEPEGNNCFSITPVNFRETEKRQNFVRIYWLQVKKCNALTESALARLSYIHRAVNMVKYNELLNQSACRKLYIHLWNNTIYKYIYITWIQSKVALNIYVNTYILLRMTVSTPLLTESKYLLAIYLRKLFFNFHFQYIVFQFSFNLLLYVYISIVEV